MSKALCLQTLAITASNFINAITSNNTLDFRLIFHIFEISNYHNFEGMVGNSLNAGWVQIMEMLLKILWLNYNFHRLWCMRFFGVLESTDCYFDMKLELYTHYVKSFCLAHKYVSKLLRLLRFLVILKLTEWLAIWTVKVKC